MYIQERNVTHLCTSVAMHWVVRLTLHTGESPDHGEETHTQTPLA